MVPAMKDDRGEVMRYRWSIALMIMLGALGLSGAWNTSPAQGAPELWLIAHGDTVLLQVPEPPMVNEGFVVYRAEGGGEWELLTPEPVIPLDRKSTRLNSSHVAISYAVFCLKKKMKMKHDNK